MKTVEEVAAELSDAKVFSVQDATSGFLHIKLDEKSSELLTFNTPFGRNPGLGVICGLSLLLVLVPAPRFFLRPGSPVLLPPQKTTLLNSNSTWNARTPFNEFLELFGASWVNKLHLHLHFTLTFTFTFYILPKDAIWYQLSP